MAITPESIFAAADALVEQGQEPTLTAVREAVGGGSFTTISEAMKSWRARRETQRQESAAPIPADLQEAGAGLLTQIWRQAVGLSEGRLERERAALVEARADLEAQTRQAVSLADQMESELTRVGAERDAALESVQTLQAERGEMRRERDAARQEAAALGARLEELTRERDAARAEVKENIVKAATLEGALVAGRERREAAEAGAAERLAAVLARLEAAGGRS